MLEAEIVLLRELAAAEARGAFAVACDGEQRSIAHALEKAGLAEWKGSSWGSQFWAITEAGELAARQAAGA